MIASPNELTYFIELANILNFSRASERLGITQPSLSMAMKRLECNIGAPLFIRSKNGVNLTQAGKRLLSHAKQLLQMWNHVKSASLASHHDITGSLTLGCHASVALFALCDFLPNFFIKYPKIEINLKHDLSRVIMEGIINLSIDIGIVVNPLRHPDLIIQKLYEDQVTFWYSSANKNISQQIANGEITLICDPCLSQTQWLLKNSQKEGVRFNRLITSSSLEVIANLTAQGGGIGILPRCVVMKTAPSILKPLANFPIFYDEIALLYRHENRGIKAMQILSAAIKQRFKNTN